MKKQLGITLVACLLSSTAALADDTVLGALLGAGAGAVVGHSIGGRNGTIIGGALGAATGAAIANSHGSRVVYATQPAYMPPPVAYMPPPPVYVPVPAYSRQVYLNVPPVRIEQRAGYYVAGGHERSYRYNRRHERDWERDDRRYHRDDRY